MKKLLLTSLIAMAGIGQSFAASQCSLNGKEVPCSELTAGRTGVSLLIPLLMLVVGLICFIFRLRMLIDVIRHQKEEKAMWVVIVLFGSLIGALIYYFVEKKKRNKQASSGETSVQR